MLLVAHPRGQAASPEDPSFTFSLPAGSRLWLPDVIGTISAEPLSAWVEARSTAPLSVNEAYIHKLASTGRLAPDQHVDRPFVLEEPRGTQELPRLFPGEAERIRPAHPRGVPTGTSATGQAPVKRQQELTP